MRRFAACAFACALALLSAARPGACDSSPAALAAAYAPLLHPPGSPLFDVSGYAPGDRFPGVPRSELEVTLTVAGVQRRSTRPCPDGHWAFHGVPPGVHVLDVVATGYEVPAVRVDVSGSGRVRFARADAPALPLRAPLVLAPVALQLYADPAPRFGLRSLLANPVYLLLGFGALFAFVLPRWLESMDPDELKKIQEAQSKGGLAAMLGLAPGGGGGTEGEEGKEGGAAPAAAAAAEAAAQPAAGSAVKRVKKAVAAESG